MNNIFIGMGSNLENPLLQLKKSLKHLNDVEQIEVRQVSNFYMSSPMGPQDQPDYVNAVVEISTVLTAEKLLDKLQNIETQHGRVKTQRWGARTLDLDLLLYGNDVVKTKRLTVPHIGIAKRNFVLIPLSELIENDFYIPQCGKMTDLLAACSKTGIKRIHDK